LQQRKNIEGSLFLIRRRSQPRFQMLVLNKLSTGEQQQQQQAPMADMQAAAVAAGSSNQLVLNKLYTGELQQHQAAAAALQQGAAAPAPPAATNTSGRHWQQRHPSAVLLVVAAAGRLQWLATLAEAPGSGYLQSTAVMRVK
jgi:hypothetical protein